MGSATSNPVTLYLASASPRRAELLEQIGIRPDKISGVDADESLLGGEVPRDAVKRLARIKADAASGEAFDLTLTADTVVACGRRILGKPLDEADARKMLGLLSGRRHKVLTAIVLTARDGKRTERCVETRVSFKRLSSRELNAYLLSGEWEGKAGAYAIQGMADAFVKAIEGSYSNVVGLPLHETKKLLEGAGYPVYADHSIQEATRE